MDAGMVANGQDTTMGVRKLVLNHEDGMIGIYTHPETTVNQILFSCVLKHEQLKMKATQEYGGIKVNS
jgi:hypothetical protein